MFEGLGTQQARIKLISLDTERKRYSAWEADRNGCTRATSAVMETITGCEHSGSDRPLDRHSALDAISKPAN